MSQQSKTADSSTRDERRRTILRAAINVFARKGYHGCRISDVAKEAGVAYGLVYHYFKNKDELLQTVFELGWTGFISRIRAVAEGEGLLADKVRRIADVAFEAYRVDPRAVKVLILEVARSPAGTRVDRNGAYFDTIRIAEDMFARAQAAGELRQDMDPRLAGALLMGAIEMGLTACVAGFVDVRNPESLERAKAQITLTVLHGMLYGAPEQAQAEPLADAESPAARTRSRARRPS